MIIENEFSRVLETHGLGIAGKQLSYEATPKECAAVAKRFQILGINHLKTKGSIQKLPNGFFRVKTTIEAAVTQHDASTNDPITQTLKVPVTLMLAPKSYVPRDTEELNVNDDIPETIPLRGDGSIDIGEIFVQYLSLAIDPYPRAAQE